MARASIAKAILNIPSSAALIDRRASIQVTLIYIKEYSALNPLNMP
jgi:hypothetical protein